MSSTKYAGRTGTSVGTVLLLSCVSFLSGCGDTDTCTDETQKSGIPRQALEVRVKEAAQEDGLCSHSLKVTREYLDEDDEKYGTRDSFESDVIYEIMGCSILGQDCVCRPMENPPASATYTIELHDGSDTDGRPIESKSVRVAVDACGNATTEQVVFAPFDGGGGMGGGGN